MERLSAPVGANLGWAGVLLPASCQRHRLSNKVNQASKLSEILLRPF